MGSLESNKALAKRYFDALSDQDSALMDSLLHEDLEYWVLGTLPGMSGTHGKAALMGMLEPFFGMWDGRLEFTVLGETAEGNRVALELRNHGRKKDGKVYQNFYHILFEIKDDRIYRIREYFDTMHARDTII